ncbi:hypothetical protein VNF293_35820 [Atlantibacter hermannii]
MFFFKGENANFFVNSSTDSPRVTLLYWIGISVPVSWQDNAMAPWLNTYKITGTLSLLFAFKCHAGK